MRAMTEANLVNVKYNVMPQMCCTAMQDMLVEAVIPMVGLFHPDYYKEFMLFVHDVLGKSFMAPPLSAK